MIAQPTLTSRRALRIEPFRVEHITAVQALNRRLAAGGIAWRFPEDPTPDWLAPADGARIYQEFFLLFEGEDVRGAYVLKRHEASMGGAVEPIGNFYLPLSEGIIDRTYALVGTRLVRDAISRQPLLYSVGMGSADAPVARLTRALGWPLRSVPFYFKVLQGGRFLRETRYLRRGKLSAALLDVAARAGIGALAAQVANRLLTRRGHAHDGRSEPVAACEEWVDALWGGCRTRYSFAAVRDSHTLNRVYPPATRQASVLRISRGPRTIGCAVIQETQRAGQKYFGNLRVGTIVDTVAQPEDADLVISRASGELEGRGAELLVSNQMHPAWRAALRRAGFVRGPSNFFLALSPALAARSARFDPDWRCFHINRGDGDVPWPGDRLASDEAARGTP